METVVLLPSLGRPASDFHELCVSLQAVGFNTLPIDPPRSLSGEPTLHDLARYVIESIDTEEIASFHLVGHAFGNRLARMVTTDYPERVLSLTLLAAGGYVEMERDILQSLIGCFDETLSAEMHMHHVSRAFFAEGNNSEVWRGGWMSDVMRLQQAALSRVDRTEWWDAIAPRVLVVQALQDVIAPVGNGQKYASDHPAITTLVDIDGAGHAMLPEQPTAISAALISFLMQSVT
jgi:pimeloyl-ACP methyl ester carboxylesterase